jgi:hypothetical protein
MTTEAQMVQEVLLSDSFILQALSLKTGLTNQEVILALRELLNRQRDTDGS